MEAGDWRRRFSPHDQDPGPGKSRREIDDGYEAGEVGRVTGRLLTHKAEPFVEALQLAPAGEVQHRCRLARKECLDDRVADAPPLSVGHDCNRGQLTAPIPMRFYLAQPGNHAIFLRDHEM